MIETRRNEPCPCGSGKRFKSCCGSLSPATADQRAMQEAAVGSEDSRAAVQAGLQYLMASDAPPNTAYGVKLIEQAALAGDPEGAALAATLASTSLWRERDWDQAFDHLVVAAEKGHELSQSSLRILAGGPAGDMAQGDDWRRMRDQIDLAAWLTPPPMRTIRDAPRMCAIENFAPVSVCNWLIACARDQLSRATIYDRVTGGATEDGRRTNSQCDLNVDTCGVLTFILRARIAAIVNRPEEAMEIPKILHYAPGETFEEHYDYLDPKEPAYALELATRGQRCQTFLLYLNDDFTGGETSFPEIAVAHRGAQGDAFLFANINAAAELDRDTRHAGLPPETGEKWVFSQSIRDLPRS
jgi:prolyl 4-hydroxylase